MQAISLQRSANSLGFFKTDAFPGVNGDAIVTVYHRNKHLEFTIKPNGTITFYKEADGQEVCYAEGLSGEAALTRLEAFREET